MVKFQLKLWPTPIPPLSKVAGVGDWGVPGVVGLVVAEWTRVPELVQVTVPPTGMFTCGGLKPESVMVTLAFWPSASAAGASGSPARRRGMARAAARRPFI